MSLGIPAIKIRSGGTGGRGHSLEDGSMWRLNLPTGGWPPCWPLPGSPDHRRIDIHRRYASV
jgi:hypothetical protein